MEIKENKWKEGNIYSKDKETFYRLKENILEKITDEIDLIDKIEIDLNKDKPKEWINMFNIQLIHI